MKRQHILILFFLISINLSGQGRYIKEDPLTFLLQDSLSRHETIIGSDEGIEENYYKHLIYNSNNPAVMGYRIRIFSGSGNNAYQQANQARSRFISKYPEIGDTLFYDAPDFKVYVGNCRTRSEVLKLFERIKRDFPYAFIPPKQAIDPKKYKSLIVDE